MNHQHESINPFRPAAFSLIELVIVIVMIGIIAAIAVPRFSRANANASREQAEGTVAVLQDAIDLFTAEHNENYLITEAALNGREGPPAVAGVLTAATLKNGNVDESGQYGPYLRSLLANPMRSPAATKFVHTNAADGARVPGARPYHGWIFTHRNGKVIVGYLDAHGKGVWPQDSQPSNR